MSSLPLRRPFHYWISNFLLFISSSSPLPTFQTVLGGAGDSPVILLPQTLDALNQELAKVEDLARKRKLKLETSKKYHQFNANIDEEDAWVGVLCLLRMKTSTYISAQGRNIENRLDETQSTSPMTLHTKFHNDSTFQ